MNRYKILEIRWSKELNKKPFNKSLINSKNKHWWSCPKKHNFLSTGAKITTLENGCPYCSNKKILKGYNDFQTLYPKISKEWHPTLNTIKPDEIFAGSRTKIWWLCKNKHKWLVSIYARKQGNKCPYCSNQKLLKGYNDFESQAPKHILEEWDYSKNTLKSDEVIVGSNIKAHWICKQNHSWITTVKHRTKGLTQCPNCTRQQKTSKLEKDITKYIKNILKDKHEVIENDRSILDGKELDIYIPDLKIGIEINGNYWHSNDFILKKTSLTSEEHHSNKKELCKAKGIILYFVWEKDWIENKKKIEDSLKNLLIFNKSNKILEKLQNESSL